MASVVEFIPEVKAESLTCALLNNTPLAISDPLPTSPNVLDTLPKDFTGDQLNDFTLIDIGEIEFRAFFCD